MGTVLLCRNPHNHARRTLLACTAKTASGVSNQGLAAARGSQPVWQIPISLKTSPMANQRELAGAVSIQGATLLEAAAVLSAPEQPDLRVLVDGRGTVGARA